MSARIHARARVQLTIEIVVGDRWDEKTSMDQIHKQATEAALCLLKQHKLAIEGQVMGLGEIHPHPIEICGRPKVTAILVEEER